MEVRRRYVADAAPGGGVAPVEVAGTNAPKESGMSDEVVVSTESEESETSSDIPADPTTTATIAVGDTISGQVETPGDRDWFAVELEAGHTYTIDLRGSRTDDGTLYDPYLRGIYDDRGQSISLTTDVTTTDDNSGDGPNSHLVFEAPRSGTYYIAAGAWGGYLGTYELEVWDTSADDTRGGARELGDITSLDAARFPRSTLDGDGDRVDYYRFHAVGDEDGQSRSSPAGRRCGPVRGGWRGPSACRQRRARHGEREGRCDAGGRDVLRSGGVSGHGDQRLHLALRGLGRGRGRGSYRR